MIEKINFNSSDPRFMPLGGKELSQLELDVIQNFLELFCQ